MRPVWWVFGLRRSELFLVDFEEDFSLQDGRWCCDMSNYVLKSNHTKKVYVKCLCAEADLKHLCVCKAIRILRERQLGEDGGEVDCPLLGFSEEFSEAFGHGKLHSLRIGHWGGSGAGAGIAGFSESNL